MVPALTLGCALRLAARVVDAARRVRNAVAPLWWGWLIHR